MESDNLSIENTACEFILPDIETLNVNTLDDNKITATVQPLVDGDPNFVGSEDGFITLSFKPGKGFSKWGGAIIFRAPNWFSANVDSNDNSNGSQKTTSTLSDEMECNSEDIVIIGAKTDNVCNDKVPGLFQ